MIRRYGYPEYHLNDTIAGHAGAGCSHDSCRVEVADKMAMVSMRKCSDYRASAQRSTSAQGDMDIRLMFGSKHVVEFVGQVLTAAVSVQAEQAKEFLSYPRPLCISGDTTDISCDSWRPHINGSYSIKITVGLRKSRRITKTAGGLVGFIVIEA